MENFATLSCINQRQMTLKVLKGQSVNKYLVNFDSKKKIYWAMKLKVGNLLPKT